MNWQPIETAPQDGTVILLAEKTKSGVVLVTGRWGFQRYHKDLQIQLSKLACRTLEHEGDSWIIEGSLNNATEYYNIFHPDFWCPIVFKEPPVTDKLLEEFWDLA